MARQAAQPQSPPLSANPRAAPSAASVNANRPQRDYELLMAISRADWDGQAGVKNILETSIVDEPHCDYFRHPFTNAGETAIHMAVQALAGKKTSFLKNVVDFYVFNGVDLTTLRDFVGRTPLHQAAEAGDLDAAKLLVETDARMLLVEDFSCCMPIHAVASAAQRELLVYLLEQTKLADPTFIQSNSCFRLLICIVQAGLNDIAYQVLKEVPHMAREVDDKLQAIIHYLAKDRKAFPSGSDFSLWEKIAYSWISIEPEALEESRSKGDVENPNNQQAPQPSWLLLQLARVGKRLYSLLWKVVEILVPTMKRVRDRKIVHHHSLKLAKLLCSQVHNLPESVLNFTMHLATEEGIHEILEEILTTYPPAIYYFNVDNHSFIHLAVKYRHVSVYNLIFQMGGMKSRILGIKSEPMGNLLHLAARLPTQERLNVVSGAALQMQRELQWFQEVEKVVEPHYKRLSDGPEAGPEAGPLDRRWPNWKCRIPSVLFAEEHRELVKEGEQWMKDTANSCTIAAVLIATVVFAASITVPGGNNSDSGSPIFKNEKAFTAFAFFDAIALYSSMASVIMFLSILTSRYTQEDFLHSLPQKLIIGLVSLFLSMTSMMAAFSAAMFLVFGHKNNWIFALVGTFSCLPVGLFVLSQFPLLVEMMKSTYGRSIFRKQSDHVIF